MKLSISTKLFVAVSAGVLLVILSMGLATSWSFGRGFLGYINEQALERMATVVPRLASAYAREGNWAFMRNRPDRWFDIMRPDPDEERVTHDLRTPLASDLTGALFRIALLDKDRKRVTGYTAIGEDALVSPIVVAGETVGYAHAGEMSAAALKRAANAVGAVAHGHDGTYSEPPVGTNRKLYSEENPIGAPSFEEKAQLLQRIDRYLRDKDSRVRQVTASISASPLSTPPLSLKSLKP